MQGSPQAALERRAAMGLGLAYVDGCDLISQVLARQLIDDLVVTKVPVLLGRGYHPVTVSAPLRSEAVKSWPSGLVRLTYSRVQAGGP